MMSKTRAAWMAVCSIAFSMACAATQSGPAAPPSSQPADGELEAVLVTGEQPGPGLWKVSRADHVMWILGSLEPLPKGMLWRSNDVEPLIAGSQEVLYPGERKVSTDIGFFRGITLLPALFKAGRNPDDARLKDVLPADAYAKWQVLKARYIGDDSGIERWRPAFAAYLLRRAALKKSALVYTTDIESVVGKIAKKHGVRIHTLPPVNRKVRIENPRGVLKNVSQTEFSDAGCFTRSMDRLEPDIDAMKARATAWARGDLATLRTLKYADDDCRLSLMKVLEAGRLQDGANLKRMIDDLRQQREQANEELEQDWFAAAQAALAGNRETFAVLPIDDLLRPDGYVTRLRAMGYSVEEPN